MLTLYTVGYVRMVSDLALLLVEWTKSGNEAPLEMAYTINERSGWGYGGADTGTPICCVDVVEENGFELPLDLIKDAWLVTQHALAGEGTQR